MKNPALACRFAAGLLVAGTLSAPVFADSPAGGYDPQALFAPLSLPDAANAFRGGAGKQGPLFWQNRADYAIQAELDPATHSLRGEETITYTNRSPDALDVLWLQLDQNIYRRDSRSALAANPKATSAGLMPAFKFVTQYATSGSAGARPRRSTYKPWTQLGPVPPWFWMYSAEPMKPASNRSSVRPCCMEAIQ